MKKISNTTVCNFFYSFFVVYVVIAVLSLAGLVGILAFAKLPKSLAIVQGFYGFILLSLSVTMALSHYLVCDRALLKENKD